MEFLRLKNLFGQPPVIGNDLPQQGGITGNIPYNSDMFGPRQDPWGNVSFGPSRVKATSEMALPASEPGYDVNKRMSEIYTPETEATQKFTEMVGNYPRLENYKPSMLRRIGSALIATGGSFNQRGQFQPNSAAMESGMEFLNRPHTEKYIDWKNQIGPLQQAATNERYSNINERTMAYQTVASELRQKAQEAKDKNDTINAQIRQQRADAYELKARNPNMKFDFSGPTVLMANPATGQVTDTKIPTGSMSDVDKMTLAQEQALEKITATGEQARQTEDVRQTNRMETIGARGEQARTTKSTPSGATGSKGELPTQTRVRQFNAAREILNSRPDLRQFIQIGNPGSQDFTITPPNPSAWTQAGRGPTQQQYEEIQRLIYGDNQSNKTQRMVKTQRNNKTGATRQVESLDGGKTWQPVSNQ